MRKRYCKGRYYKAGAYHNFEIGKFHQWGSNYEEFENGAGNYSVAIVELPDGTVVMPVADDICFLESEELNRLIEECSNKSDTVYTLEWARNTLNRYRDHVCMTMLGLTGEDEVKTIYDLFNALKMGELALYKQEKREKEETQSEKGMPGVSQGICDGADR
ncbi:hypothetical protein NSB25_11115 [Acetatifactor muris]|jgi:hypothetical protein|uniref:Uncharacterized protein n=1 Tax=Acetatifactor muris TaxID=879566 RepID=A0A2K4ZGT0_9FIRM|nr:hypothetical protein [Acetatifactor muris]MCR2047833.1 hypothetical protein [Acetatifactor muris]SOY29636.1 hypothetical protein AMURIS_02357 [Acetatifactor muris]